METLELRTLILATATAWVVAAAVLTYTFRTQRTYPGFGLWTLHSAVIACGLLLLVLRGVAPDWISILLGNAFLSAGALVMPMSARVFGGRNPHAMAFLAAWAAYMAWTLWFTAAAPSYEKRVLGIAVLVTATTGLAAWHLLTHTSAQYRASAVFTGAVMALSSATMVVRGVASVTDGPGSDLFTLVPDAMAMWMVALAVGVLGAFGMLMMNHQRLAGELEGARDELQATLEALRASAAEVRVLEGLLPICSSCKRIKNEDGGWVRIEKYIQEHSMASFTHGICPGCAAQLYPGVLDDPGT